MDKILFDSAELEKKAIRYLTNEPTNWIKDIITELLTKFPQLADVELGVEWRKTDYEKGSAVGIVNIQQLAYVPVIVDDFMLHDLDVMIIGSKTYPLTHETILQLFKNPEVFALSITDPRKSLDTDLFGKTLQNPDGFSTTREVKYASVLDKVANTVLHEDLYNVMSIVGPITQELEANGCGEILEKLASIKPTNEESFMKSMLRGLEMDRQYVYTDELGNSFVKQASSKVNYTYKIDVSPEEFDKHVNKTACDEIEKTADIPDIPDIPKWYKLLDGNGDMFLHRDGSYVVTDRDMLGTDIDKLANLSSQKYEPEGVIPKMGDTGMWVIDNQYASRPFEVVGMQKMAGIGNFEVVGWNGLERTTYYPLKGVHRNDLIEHDRYDDSYYVPGNAKFIKVGSRIDGDLRELTNHVNSLNAHCVEKDSAGLYNMTGSEFSKYGEHTRSLTYDDAMWTAVHCNVTEADIKQIEMMKMGEVVHLAHVKAPLSLLDLEYRLFEEYKRSFDDSHKTIVKEASEILKHANKKTVDAVLALGLLNKSNVGEYVEAIPVYEDTLSYLAKLLLATRIGLKGVSASSTKAAMESLAGVVTSLKGLRAVMK